MDGPIPPEMAIKVLIPAQNIVFHYNQPNKDSLVGKYKHFQIKHKDREKLLILKNKHIFSSRTTKIKALMNSFSQNEEQLVAVIVYSSIKSASTTGFWKNSRFNSSGSLVN